MNYVILAAGMGTRLHPLTKHYPKSLLSIGKGQTLIERMIALIRKFDKPAQIILVLGFKHDEIEKKISGCKIILNPFYAFTNSIASLWFAKDFLDNDVTIINGDVIISEEIMKKIVGLEKKPIVLLDSSVKKDSDYNVEVNNDLVVVMSKQLSSYYGEYAGITRLDKKAAIALKEQICSMINNGNYNDWYEDGLVQMIFEKEFKLGFLDIADFEWREIDSVNDLLAAKEIISKENNE